jgi:hypothetical protein
MDRRKRDHFGSNRPKHRARTRRDDTSVDAAEQGRSDSKILSIAALEAVRQELRRANTRKCKRRDERLQDDTRRLTRSGRSSIL